MTVVFIAPCTSVYTVVGMEEDDETGLLDGSPHGVQSFVVESSSNSPCAHDQAAQVRQFADLLHDIQQS